MATIDYSDYKEAVYDNLITGIVYGAYLVVYAASVYVFMRRSGQAFSRPRMIMFGITTFTFVLGIIALVLDINFQFQATLLDNDQDEDPMHSPLMISFRGITATWATITRLMYILSDLICAWRTVVLWDRNKRIIAILLFFILGATVAAVCDIYFTVAFLYTGEIKLSIEDPSKVGQRAMIVVSTTLATNLVSTGLIAWKAWQRRVPVQEHLREGSRFVRIDRVLALLIESGFIYCCIWILYLMSAFDLIHDPGFTAMAFVSGLYSTLIIILVGMKMSPVEHFSTHSDRMPFARGSAFGRPSESSVPPPVFTIHREYVTDFESQIPSTARSTAYSLDEEKKLLP